MRVRFSPLAPEQKKKERLRSLFFLVARTRKTHVVGLLAPEQKRKSIHTLYFFWSPVRENLRSKVTRTRLQKEEHLCSYFL